MIDEITQSIAKEVVASTERSQQEIVKLAEDYKNAADFLDSATESVNSAWIKWLRDSKQYLFELRTWKMALQTECAEGKKLAKDLNDFLLSEETEGKLKLLKEFVDVAERMKALKDSGFMDSIVDVLLKIKP